MRQSTKIENESSHSPKASNRNDSEDEFSIMDWMYQQQENSSRQLTFDDVQQALFTLSNISIPLPESKISSKLDRSCCRLIRSDRSSRLSLPLARRSRVDFSSYPSSILCSKCLIIKHQQEDMIKNQINSSNENERQIEFSLLDEKDSSVLTNYQSAQMLVWNVKNSSNQTENSPLCYDSGSLTVHEKKFILNETIKKLQSLLANPSSNDQTTTKALETSIRVLSSSIERS